MDLQDEFLQKQIKSFSFFSLSWKFTNLTKRLLFLYIQWGSSRSNEGMCNRSTAFLSCCFLNGAIAWGQWGKYSFWWDLHLDYWSILKFSYHSPLWAQSLSFWVSVFAVVRSQCLLLCCHIMHLISRNAMRYWMVYPSLFALELEPLCGAWTLMWSLYPYVEYEPFCGAWAPLWEHKPLCGALAFLWSMSPSVEH